MLNALHSQAEPSLAIMDHVFRVSALEYTSILNPFARARPLHARFDHADTNVRGWQSESVLASLGESTPLVRVRSEREIQDVGHLIEISRFISGEERGISGDKIIHRVPGPIYVMDHRYPLQCLTTSFRVQQLFFSRAELYIPADWELRARVLASDTPVGQLLHECLTDLYSALEQNAGSIPISLVERFKALLKVALGVPAERGDVRTQMRQIVFEKICVFIEQNLGNPAFSTEAILGMFGVSRASLYRMFQPFDGVRNYIMHRRALRAVLDIASPHAFEGRQRAV